MWDSAISRYPSFVCNASPNCSLSRDVSADSQTASFPEGATLLFKGRVEVPLPDDDPTCFAILMDIIHSKNGVPRQVSLNTLTTLSILVDKYSLQKAVSRYSGLWIDAIKRDIPQTMTPDIFHWLSIAWVFQAGDEFNHLTRILERESDGTDVDNYSKELKEYLPIPQVVTGMHSHINTQRLHMLMQARYHSSEKTKSLGVCIRIHWLLVQYPPISKDTLQR